MFYHYMRLSAFLADSLTEMVFDQIAMSAGDDQEVPVYDYIGAVPEATVWLRPKD